MRRLKRRVSKVRKYKYYQLFGFSCLLFGLTAGCIWLFFQRVGVSLCIAVCLLPVIFWKARCILTERFDRRVTKEFCDILITMSGSLSAGLGLERCICEIAESSNGEFPILKAEFCRMQQLLQLNWPVEYVFEDLAQRYAHPDMRTFSTALRVGIPSGINLVELVRSIAAAARVQRDTEQEIRKVLNLPKYNNRIVMLMPFFSIFTVRMIAPSYAATLDTGVGLLILGAACCLLGIAFLLGEVLGKIRY